MKFLPGGPTAVRLRLALTAAAMFGGLALLAHIVTGVPLPTALIGTIAFAIAAARLVWIRLNREQRAAVRAVAGVGVRSGIIATAAYDAAKFVLSQWDPSPYNPFEAIRIFGILLVGVTASPVLAYAAGTSFHLMNGITFGVGYALLLGNRGISAGVAWALGLEMFQLALYPEWLRVQFVREFAQISAASHVVYGATLGACVRRGVSAIRRRASCAWMPPH